MMPGLSETTRNQGLPAVGNGQLPADQCGFEDAAAAAGALLVVFYRFFWCCFLSRRWFTATGFFFFIGALMSVFGAVLAVVLGRWFCSLTAGLKTGFIPV
jgi:hypothetical protein